MLYSLEVAVFVPVKYEDNYANAISGQLTRPSATPEVLTRFRRRRGACTAGTGYKPAACPGRPEEDTERRGRKGLCRPECWGPGLPSWARVPIHSEPDSSQ